MTNDLAVRNGHAQPSAALAIRGNQDMWDDKQRAALVAMGVSEKATNAELAVFFHQCRNTQLDPFLKQIYLIHRRAKDGDRWVDKPTTQIGIDGFRVIRDRIADKKGLRVEYEDTIWYDEDRSPYDVWVWDEPPAACKVVVLVDGRRFPAVLRFNEYCQKSKDGDRLGRWRDGFAHQIEKCAEADALRKAFPNDMSGLVLEDTAPLSDPDAPERLPQDRRHVTAEDIRQRHTVTAEVVTPPDASPAQAATPVAAEPHTPPPAGAGEALPPLPGEEEITAPVPGDEARAPEGAKAGSSGPGAADDLDYDTPGTVRQPQLTAIWTILSQVFKFASDEKEQARAVCAHIVDRDLGTSNNLSKNEAKTVLDTLAHWQQQAKDKGDEPRDYLIAVMVAQDTAGEPDVD